MVTTAISSTVLCKIEYISSSMAVQIHYIGQMLLAAHNAT